MTRLISVITASSISGHACVKTLLAAALASAAVDDDDDNKKTGGPSIKVRACFRSAEKSQAFAASNICEIFTGVDAGIPATLRAALENADVAVLVTPHDLHRGMEDDAQLSINMVQAALDQGVKRIIHVGSWTVRAPPESLPHLQGRFLPTERYFQETVSGGGGHQETEWTVLRGGYFMANHLMLFKNNTDGTVAFPNIYTPSVDTRDIGAAAAALCLMSSSEYKQKYNQKFVECSGPEMLSTEQVVATVQNVTGKHYRYEEKDLEEFLQETKPPPFLQELLTYMAKNNKDAIPFVPNELQDLLGHPPTSFGQFVRNHLHVFEK